MPSLRLIRRRIRSIKNTAKVTKAMEMVAASKMRRAQLNVVATRPYAAKMREVLADLAARFRPEEERVLLLERRPAHRIALIHVAADRGLCGGFNANVNRRAGQFLVDENLPAYVVAVGRKGRDFMVRFGRDLRAEFTSLGDYPKLIDILPIARIVVQDYVNGEVDRVYLSFNEFVNTMVQRPTIRELLPVEPPPDTHGPQIEYIFEPSPTAVLNELLPRYVEMQIYQAILESIASEFSARMVAMRSATENANEVVDALTLSYNKARQESITKELLDLVGGAAVLQGG